MEKDKLKNNFSRILGEKRLTISTVARETGISRFTLTQLYYERTKYIQSKTLYALCNYFAIAPGDFLKDLTD